MENTNTIHFRKSGNDLISVTELNTKITYTLDREFTIGRLVVSYTRVALKSTAKARFNYFMYNNRLARFKRGVMPFITRQAARIGLRVYMAQ